MVPVQSKRSVRMRVRSAPVKTEAKLIWFIMIWVDHELPICSSTVNKSTYLYFSNNCMAEIVHHLCGDLSGIKRTTYPGHTSNLCAASVFMIPWMIKSYICFLIIHLPPLILAILPADAQHLFSWVHAWSKLYMFSYNPLTIGYAMYLSSFTY